MSYLHLLRTVHCPVSSDGKLIKNNFGVIVATATDPTVAAAMAALINFGVSRARREDEKHFEMEQRLAAGLRRDT